MLAVRKKTCGDSREDFLIGVLQLGRLLHVDLAVEQCVEVHFAVMGVALELQHFDIRVLTLFEIRLSSQKVTDVTP